MIMEICMAEFNTNGKLGVLFNGVWNASGIDESLVDAIEPALFREISLFHQQVADLQLQTA